MVFDWDDGFIEREGVLLSGEVGDAEGWGDFDWEWDVGDFDVVFGGLRELSHWGKYYKVVINFKRLKLKMREWYVSKG